ncbi:MAG: replication protein [Deltaproteobacteria bacterium]|nr:replication protein [Deltaproteobacteria bacterium]
MASPQCKDGYTRIANEPLEALCRAKLTLYEWRVFMAIIRFTYGYNRKVDQISVRQLSRITSHSQEGGQAAGVSCKSGAVIRASGPLPCCRFDAGTKRDKGMESGKLSQP